MKIAYIFTTFPKLSERFFLREVLELKRQGVELDLYSIFGGSDISEAGSVVRMHFSDWIHLLIELLYWLGRRPKAVLLLCLRLNPFRYRSAINYGENVLGLAFGLRFARRFRAQGYAYAHATWATAPGMVAWVFFQLIDLRYSIEAHAYDVFRDGGDAFLAEKLLVAESVRSSTRATSSELEARLQLEGGKKEIVCVRRGLDSISEYRKPVYRPGACLNVLSVGRLIEKKGYLQQLEIFAQWRALEISFRGVIIGDGPMRSKLQTSIDQMGLSDCVTLTGRQAYPAVEKAYQDADAFLFCGQVSASGDRDGFPNVIGEAMGHSLPVFSTDVSGTTEGVQDEVTGFIIDASLPDSSASKIYSQMQQPAAIQAVTLAAHQWLQSEFSTSINAARLREALWEK